MRPTPVTVLGLGAMGRALATAFLDAGHPTTVWNRSPGRTAGFAERGAVVAPTAEEAAAASPLVVLCVTDYSACADLVDGLGDTPAGRTLVNLSTGTPEEAGAVAAVAAELGAGYLDGVVQAAPCDIGTRRATLLLSGPRDLFESHERALRVLGEVTYVGADPGRACRYDMALLGLWYEAELAFLNALALVGGPEADLETFVSFARGQLGYVVGSLATTARDIAESRHPRGPATLPEHARVLSRLVTLRRAAGMPAEPLALLDGLVRRLVENGYTEDGFTRVFDALTTD